MTSSEIDQITNLLETSRVDNDGELSFCGFGLKLNSASDATTVTDRMKKCKLLTSFNLDGNTIGVDAAKEIGKCLESHPEFQYAIWKNMFTGRTKEEIPVALRHMCNGIILANAKLVVLDLSDNAFGPIGIDGVVDLLKSESCFTIKELILNNNGLGIFGARTLAKGLMSCHRISNGEFSLKTFIAGRNRLENNGAEALAQVFKTMKTLEKISIPQNGIYYKGITALCDAFKCNPNLKEINLNDNTLSVKGAKVLSGVLPFLNDLEILNVGDCLLKTKGALYIAEAIAEGQQKLKALVLDGNEIKMKGILALVAAIADKSEMRSLSLNDNDFGVNGVSRVMNLLKKNQQEHILETIEDEEESTSFEDDAIVIDGDDDDDDDDDDESDSNDDNEEVDSDDVDDEDNHYEGNIEKIENHTNDAIYENGTEDTFAMRIADFLKYPNNETFKNIGSDFTQHFIDYLVLLPEADFKQEAIRVILLISNLCFVEDADVSNAALETSVQLYKFIFEKSHDPNYLTDLMNILLVQLRLIKAESKDCLVDIVPKRAIAALETAIGQKCIPENQADIITFVIIQKLEK